MVKLLSKIKIYIIGSIIIGLIGFGLKWYIEKLHSEINNLKTDIETLETVNKENIQLIDTLKKENKKNLISLKDLSQKLEKSKEYQNSLLEKLINHDLTKLSNQKPGLIENRVNNATKELFDELENITTN